MKYFFFSLLLFSFIEAHSQSDTIAVEGKTVFGTMTGNYPDRIIFKDYTSTEYLVMKDRLNKFNIRYPVQYNGVWGFEYVSNLQKLNAGALPEFKDQKYYLKQSGTWGINSAVLIVTGGILTGIGAALTNSGHSEYRILTTSGSAIASIGATLLIPTFVFVLKAGKTKTYRTL